MFYETIDLYEGPLRGSERGPHAKGKLTVYCRERQLDLAKKDRPAVLILPGGGYAMCSAREKEPVALRFLDEGYAVFVLDYAVGVAYPAPLIEAAAAVVYIRQNAARYEADPNRLAVVGFSAGGHLAGMLATMFDAEEIKRALGGDGTSVRPDAAVLCYPVLTTERGFTHEDTARTVSGGDERLRALLSLENRVTAKSSPAFLWHTAEDDAVPVESSLRYAAACRKAGVPFELHVFEKGWHGVSLCTRDTERTEEALAAIAHLKVWTSLAFAWLEKRGFTVGMVD